MTTAEITRRPAHEGDAIVRADAQTTARVVESMVLRGDISALSPEERARFYLQMCESLGLSAASQPLAVLRLNGKEILYPTRGATDQLAAIHRLNRRIVDGPKLVDIAGTKMIYAVCEATHPNGRSETAVATVPAQDLINALMKCETKAKRRATLSILGLGMLDETEIDTIPANLRSEVPPPSSEELASAAQPQRPSRGLTDAQKASLAVPILAAYDAGIERGESPDALYEVAHTAAKTAGIATYVQAQLRDRVATAAAARRAEIASAAEVIDRLNADLANANDTPAAIVAAWLDSSDAVRRLAEEDRQKAWAQAEAAWGVSGAAGSLRDAVKAESAKRAK
jgi:hypothetical protein